ncbi:ADP-ribosylation factor 4 [Pelomyxa schiedti]|nr:ADP-ribosylation factor 4 [Pelomyxa schiedti]
MGCGKSKPLEQRVMMVGLDSAGKTTVLHRLHKGERVDTEPTLGFNVEVIEHTGAKLTIWDLGGQEKIRPCWREYFMLANGVIFVVDASEPSRFKEATNELTKIMQAPSLKTAPLLVFANKQDNPGAVTADQLRTDLGLDDLATGRPYLVQQANARDGVGLWEGMEWLIDRLKDAQAKS